MAKGEKLLYQENKSAYGLVLGFLMLNLAITLFVLRAMAVNAGIGVFIMYNIVLSLVGFLVAIKIKKYSMGFGVFTIILGVFHFVVNFIMTGLPASTQNPAATLLTALASLMLAAGGIITIRKTKLRRQYLIHREP